MKNKKNINEPFTQVPNRILNDKELSLAAKGLIAILLSNAEDWKITLEEIYRRSHNREKSHKTVFDELKTKGYFTQKKNRNPVTRQIEWTNKIHSFPVEPSLRTVPMHKQKMQGEGTQGEPTQGYANNNTQLNKTTPTNTNTENNTAAIKTEELKKEKNISQEGTISTEQESQVSNTEGWGVSKWPEGDLPF